MEPFHLVQLQACGIGCTLIEKDHLGDWNPEKDFCLRLTFRQPERKPSSESSSNHFLRYWMCYLLSQNSESQILSFPLRNGETLTVCCERRTEILIGEA